MAVGDLLKRAAGFVRGIFTVVGNTDFTELGEAALAVERFHTAIAACDWSDAEDVGGVIDAGVVALREGADVTATQVDDQFAEIVGNLATSHRAFLVQAITFFAGRPDATAADLEAAIADPSMPVDAQALGGNVSFWIQVAFELWSLIQAARKSL